jgi:Glutaminase/Asparaginase C-terminal domain
VVWAGPFFSAACGLYCHDDDATWHALGGAAERLRTSSCRPAPLAACLIRLPGARFPVALPLLDDGAETPETIVPAPNRLAATTGGEQVAQPKQQQSWRQRQQRQIRLHSRRIECIAKRFAASKVSTQAIDDDQKDAGGQQPVADGLDDTAHATTRTLKTPRVPRTDCPWVGLDAQVRLGDCASDVAGREHHPRGGRAGSGSSGDPLPRRAGMVAADNLNPQKARILLMLALTRRQDISEIRRTFAT